MANELSITLPMPPTVNQYWRHACKNNRAIVYVSPQGKAYKRSVAQLVKQKPSDQRLKVIVEMSFKSRHKNDLDNRLKALLDSLNGVLWHDDSQINVLMATRGEVGGDCVKLTVSEIQ